MNTSNQTEVLLNIQQLIDNSRCGIEGFFTDSRVAANNIMKYLQSENMMLKNEASFQMNYNEKSQAA